MKITYTPTSRSGRCNRWSLCRCALHLALVFAAFPLAVLAVDGEDKTAWQHRTAVYLWMAGLDGTTGNSMQAGEVEASFSDIMNNFEAGFMSDYRGKKGKMGPGPRPHLSQYWSKPYDYRSESGTGRTANRLCRR